MFNSKLPFFHHLIQKFIHRPTLQSMLMVSDRCRPLLFHRRIEGNGSRRFLRIFQSTINPSLFLKLNVHSNIFPPLPKKSKKIITKLLEKIETQSSISSKWTTKRSVQARFFIERHVYRTRITNLDSLAKTLFQICARVHRGVCTRVVQAASIAK